MKIPSIFGRRPRPQPYQCTYCNNDVADGDVFFRCRNDDCVEPILNVTACVQRYCGMMLASTAEQIAMKTAEEERIKGILTRGRAVFKPQQYAHKVGCPRCRTETHIKICSHCLNDLPSVLEPSDTVTIVGMRSSGKTCYTVALADTLSKSVARRFGAGIRFEDSKGENYFRDLIRQIRKEGRPPGATLKGDDKSISKNVQAQSVRITVSFPQSEVKGNASKERTSINGEIKAPSLVFHDPAGEWYTRDNVHQTTFLSNTRSIIFLVDPYGLSDFRPTKPGAKLEAEPDDPQVALSSIVDRLRAHLQLPKNKKIEKDLAVVITKADAGVFGTGPSPDQFPSLRSPYQVSTAEKIGRLCREALMAEDRLNAPNIVTEAVNNFANVEFFAVSALGESVNSDNRIDPGKWKPKRVEDPFLWIMHRWNVL